MPVRTYDIFLTNESGSTLTKTFNHLCHGSFTPGLAPPDSIAPSQTIRLKAESDGLATGTEGYIKYSIEGRDIVYIYWDNPFTLGVTHVKTQVSTEDIEPDCDFEKTNGNTFQPPPSHFEIFTIFQAQGTAPDAPEVVGEIPLAPFFVFANTGIKEHALIELILSRKPNNLKTFAVRRKIDLTKGIRHLVSSSQVISLKTIMGLS